MKRFEIRLLLLSFACAGVLAAQKCSDQPARFFLYPKTQLQDGVTEVDSAIRGDGTWFANGGGNSAYIRTCGTGDATLNLSTKRKATVVFPAPVAGSVVNKSIPAGAYPSSIFVNVRNILCQGCANPGLAFTTRAAVQIPSVVSGKTVLLRYLPYLVDAPANIASDVLAEENYPYPASPVLVTPQPYNCTTGGTTKPAWVVQGNLPNGGAMPYLQLGTAHIDTSTAANRAGQYPMPFEMRIEALQCFAAY
jgi:hypothetical protein